MSIFRRNRNQQADAPDVTPEGVVEESARESTQESTGEPAETTDEETVGAGAEPADPTAGPPEVLGPFDVSEVDGSAGRLDLGALWVKGVPGMELRLEIEEATQNVVGATAVLGDSAVQMQAFAAPKTMGIWDDIRAEIAESIVSQGGTADEQRGVLGTELRTRMPSAGPDGRTVFAPARFVGVDGPRWFLRAVFSGRAAIDEEAAEALMDVVRQTVVVRGDAAMAPRELLPLRLPQDLTDTTEAQDTEAQGPQRSADDLNPFERGPEITEVR